MSFVLTTSSRLLLPDRRPSLFGRPSSVESISFSAPAILTRSNLPARHRVGSAHPHSNNSNDPVHRPKPVLLELFIPLAFSLVLLCLRLFQGVLLPEFPRRWRDLVALAGASENSASTYPAHLWQAVVAYEDRRFFSHCGVDPIGIGRAAVSFSARGGGSTITQQIYWGHGIYGIESASMFYFGKHPSLLSFGESTMLVGLIPAPELRSPFRDPSRGVIFQVRVLRRMVEVGFLDVDMALQIVNQSVHLSPEGPNSADGLSNSFCSSEEGVMQSEKVKHGDTDRKSGGTWDWEKESKICEAREGMERWAMDFQHSKKTKASTQCAVTPVLNKYW